MNKDRQARIIKAFSEFSNPREVEASDIPNRNKEIVEAFNQMGVIAKDAAAKLEKNFDEITAAVNKTYGPPPKKRKADNYRIRVR